MKNKINKYIDILLKKVILYIYSIHSRKKIPKGYRIPHVWQVHTRHREFTPQIYINDKIKKVLFSDYVGYSTPYDLQDDFCRRINAFPEIRPYGVCGIGTQVRCYEDVIKVEKNLISYPQQIK